MDSSGMLSRFIEDSSDIVVACDLNGRITYANRSAGEAMGTETADLIGRSLLSRVEPLSRAFATAVWENPLNGEPWQGELLLQRLNSRVFPANVSASPIVDENGKVERILVIAQDISRKKLLEEEIRKRAELANSIINSAPIGIITLDRSRNVKVINPAFMEMIGGGSPVKFIDCPFETVSKEMNPDIKETIEEAFDGVETSVRNKTLKLDEQSDLTVSVISVPLIDLNGRIEGVLILTENRTELVKAESQLLQADKLASTGFLAAGIAHEINNPLAGIASIIDTLAKRVKKGGGNEEPYVRVLTNIERIKDIIRRLLEYANPTVIEPYKADLNGLLLQVMDFFMYHPIFRKIKVVKSLDENLPEITVDPKQIQQIFHNLAMNAAQAMKETGGRLEISSKYNEPLTGDRIGWIAIRMRDTGPGIPKENLRHIFDPFFTTKPPGEGTGLGLSVSYSIAKNHGGDLSARNHPEGGAEFILRLPVNAG